MNTHKSLLLFGAALSLPATRKMLRLLQPIRRSLSYASMTATAPVPLTRVLRATTE